MSSLFSKVSDRQATQLAYKVRCYPWQALSKAGRELVSWRRDCRITKAELVGVLNEDATKLTFAGREYAIVWAYCNVPTELEWQRRAADSLIAVDFRFSPAIKELAVAILDFHLPAPRATLD